MSDDPSDFKPLPRRKRSSGRTTRKRKVVGAGTPSVPRRASRAGTTAAAVAAGGVATRTARRRAKRRGRFGWLKYFALLLLIGLGVFVSLNLRTPPANTNTQVASAGTDDSGGDSGKVARPEWTATPDSLFPFFSLPEFPTAAPTKPPTPVLPEIAIIAGHWAKASSDGQPTVRDSGAICPDGLREVDITKSVADKTAQITTEDGYHTVLLQEFDPRLKKIKPDFAPKVLLSIHADSCLMGADYAFATGYKIAHAEPSDNREQDDRLVTCLTRSFDRVAAKYDKPFNANTITRDMTEYHAFREVDPSTPAAIIELGFLGYDREFLVEHQDEMAQGLATGLEQFMRGNSCLPPTPTPKPTETPAP